MDGYEFSTKVDVTSIPPVQPSDACGQAASWTQYCVNNINLMTPSIAFSEAGTALFVAKMTSPTVLWYNVTDLGDGHLGYDGPYNLFTVDSFSLGGLSEFGMTGMILSHGFNEAAADPAYVFVAVQALWPDSGQYEARIYRSEVARTQAGTLAASTPTIIYAHVGAEIRANSHNMHGGTAVSFPSGADGQPTKGLVVSFGDLNAALVYGARDDHPAAKILLMDYDGNAFNRTVFDTAHPNNLHLAYRNRNMLITRQLRTQVDPFGRFVWGENGNAFQRACLYSLMSPGRAHDLQWSGVDNTEWMSLSDPATGQSSVLYSEADTAGVWVEPFRGTETAYMASNVPVGTHYVLHSYMAPEETTAARIRTVNLEYMGNLNAPQAAGYIVIETLARATTTAVSAPMAIAIHPSGAFAFADVFNGNLFHVRFKDLPALLKSPSALVGGGCLGYDPQWFAHVPVGAWVGLGILIVSLLASTVLAIYFWRRSRKGLRIPGDDTNRALEDLARRVKTGASFGTRWLDGL